MHSKPLDIANPAFLIDAFTLDIIEENALYKSTFLSKSPMEQKQLIEAVVLHLKGLNSISFHYSIPIQTGHIDLMVWAQCNITGDSVLVVLDYQSSECMQPFDYYMIADISPSGIATVGVQDNYYRINYINRAFIKLLGYDIDEKTALVGHDFWNCIAAEDLLHIEQYRAKRNYGQNFTITATMIRKDGATIIVDLNGLFIHHSNEIQELIITVSPYLVTSKVQNRSIPVSTSVDPHFMSFRYDFFSETISFSGGFLKRITGKMCIAYSIEDVYNNKTALKLDKQKIVQAIEKIKKGKKLKYTFRAIAKGNTSYWVKVEYDFAQDIEGKNTAVVGRVYDISEQQAAKEFYDKAISLWHSNHDDCASAITVDVTAQLVVDGFSQSTPLIKIKSMSLQQYLEAVSSYLLKKTDQTWLNQQMSTKRLIALAQTQKNQFAHDFEVSYKAEHLWLRLNVTLLKNPKNDHVMALLKWTNINSMIIHKQIQQLLLAKKFDFICLIFAKTDSFSMVMNEEKTKILPLSVVNGYEAFLKDIIRQYSLPEDAQHLRICFSLKNLTNQLSINDTYSFIGHGLYPDGSPTVKYHTFQYLDAKQQIILYTREDITNQAEELSFRSSSSVHRISFRDILYVESFGKKSKVITNIGEFTANEMISSLQARLPGRKFTRCHRCYIVRNTAIKQIIQNYAVLTNGSRVPISRQNVSLLCEQVVCN